MNGEYLFVYGTLMSPFNGHYAQLLKKNAHFIGQVFLPGRLYDLGSYPGFVFDESKGLVLGELYFIPNKKTSLIQALDQYEGIDLPHPEYGRRKRIFLLENKEIEAWVYEYLLDTSHAKPIEHGNYNRYCK